MPLPDGSTIIVVNCAVFTADKAPRAEVNQAVCLACHTPKRDESFIFSWKELRAKTGAK